MIVMDVARFHVGDIKNVRYDHIAWITKDKIRNECRCANTIDYFIPREEMSRYHIART